jgi:hypothetical protein
MTTLTIYYGAAQPIKATGKHQVKALAFAEKYRGWHTFASDKTTQQAIRALESKGCLEAIGDQFRFKYPS